MNGIIFIVLLIVIVSAIWLYRRAPKTSRSDNNQPLIRIPCQDGYLVGYYVGRQFVGQRFENDRLAAEGSFVNGVQVGLGKTYYPNGTLKYDGQFVNGQASGQGRLYEENGKLKYIGHFTDGYAAGAGRIFDSNGKLKCEGHFARLPGNQLNSKDPSVPTGYCTEYHDNGQIKYQGYFLNGIWHGEGRCYDRNGRLIFKGTFRQGKPAK